MQPIRLSSCGRRSTLIDMEVRGGTPSFLRVWYALYAQYRCADSSPQVNLSCILGPYAEPSGGTTGLVSLNSPDSFGVGRGKGNAPVANASTENAMLLRFLAS
jgi:hypothetical protein